MVGGVCNSQTLLQTLFCSVGDVGDQPRDPTLTRACPMILSLQPPHPATMMPPEQLAEKVMMLQHLQMRRQDLAIELSRLDADIRQELKTLPPSDFMPPDTLDPKSAYALRALQVCSSPRHPAVAVLPPPSTHAVIWVACTTRKLTVLERRIGAPYWRAGSETAAGCDAAGLRLALPGGPQGGGREAGDQGARHRDGARLHGGVRGLEVV